MVNENVYVVYKGDMPVAVGTAKECAIAMRVKKGTVFRYTEKSRMNELMKNGRNPLNATIAYKVGVLVDGVFRDARYNVLVNKMSAFIGTIDEIADLCGTTPDKVEPFVGIPLDCVHRGMRYRIELVESDAA